MLNFRARHKEEQATRQGSRQIAPTNTAATRDMAILMHQNTFRGTSRVGRCALSFPPFLPLRGTIMSPALPDCIIFLLQTGGRDVRSCFFFLDEQSPIRRQRMFVLQRVRMRKLGPRDILRSTNAFVVTAKHVPGKVESERGRYAKVLTFHVSECCDLTSSSFVRSSVW